MLHATMIQETQFIFKQVLSPNLRVTLNQSNGTGKVQRIKQQNPAQNVSPLPIQTTLSVPCQENPATIIHPKIRQGEQPANAACSKRTKTARQANVRIQAKVGVCKPLPSVLSKQAD